MSFLCATKYDLQDVEKVAPFLAAISPLPLDKQLSKLESLKSIESTKGCLTKNWGWYAVLDKDDGREFITCRW